MAAATMTRGGRRTGKGGTAPQSTSGYFKALFTSNPALLAGRNNAEMLQLWANDHPGMPLTTSIKSVLSNVKSQLRGKGTARRVKRTRTGAIGNGTDTTTDFAATGIGARGARAMGIAIGTMRGTTAPLRHLKVAVDECIATALNIDPQGLAREIGLLGAARNGLTAQITA